MAEISPENVWQMTDEQLMRVLNGASILTKQRKIHFYAPSFMYYKTRYYCSSRNHFPTISVTGKGCALNCKHCGGIVLNTMYPATSPQKLFDLCVRLKRKGALGCLISGGCLADGSVPLAEYIDVIGRIKCELDLTVFVHTGVIGLNMAGLLKKAAVDTVLIDIIGSDETIREIYKVNATTEDYSNALKALHEVGIKFVPHIVAGLHYGNLKGELNALEMISKYDPSALVIIAFMPIHGTELEKVEPPKPLEVARAVLAARLMFPRKPVVLGCMRPKGKHRSETDVLAIRAGADAIAFASEEAVRFAQAQGYKTAFSSYCCSQVYLDARMGDM